MKLHKRAKAARYYDFFPDTPDDLDFYRQRLRSPDASVLELGCGTGRVMVPLAESCGYIHGVDSSEGMLAICSEKLSTAGLGPTKAQVELGDITRLARVYRPAR